MTHPKDTTACRCESCNTPLLGARKRFCSVPCKHESQRRHSWDITPRDIDRFWAKVNVGVGDECWTWTAAVRCGYGEIQWRGRIETATRVSWEIAFGSWPTDMVLHRC